MSELRLLGSDPDRISLSMFPDDPAKYRKTAHFRERADDSDRIIDSLLASRVIKRGQKKAARRGSWKFVLADSGLRIRVICAIGKNLTPVVQTGYAKVDDPRRAVDSGGYGRREVKVELLHNLIGTGGAFKDDITQFRLETPHRVSGHSLVTRAGMDSVRCADCGTTFRVKTEIEKTNCH